MTSAGRTLAQAKVNLALRILGRNADGYHSIETVFARIDLADSVTITVTRGERSVRCDAMPGLDPRANLAYRAAEIFASETGWPSGFAIEIEKRIPVGGGLGGGSADAGATLRILNALAPRPLDGTRLLEVAARIGADVPFLTSDHLIALAWNRGEKMQPLAPLPVKKLALLVPAAGISTSDAYASVAVLRGRYEPRPRLLTAEMFASWDEVARHSINEFEAVVAEQLPRVRDWLDRGAGLGILTRLSGSGSTVFMVDPGTKDSLQAAIASLSLGTEEKVITTRTAESVVPVEILD